MLLLGTPASLPACPDLSAERRPLPATEGLLLRTPGPSAESDAGHVPEPEPPEQEPGDQESVPAQGNPDAQPQARQRHDERDLKAELHRREGEAAGPHRSSRSATSIPSTGKASSMYQKGAISGRDVVIRTTGTRPS